MEELFCKFYEEDGLKSTTSDDLCDLRLHTWCAPLTTDPWSLTQDGLGLLDRPHPRPLALAAPVAESGTRADGEIP